MYAALQIFCVLSVHTTVQSTGLPFAQPTVPPAPQSAIACPSETQTLEMKREGTLDGRSLRAQCVHAR